MEQHRFTITGQYGGIGSLIRRRDDKIIIAEPYENFPAHKAGMMAGDVIIEVDGKQISGKNTSEVSKILKGQPGTVLKIKVKRPGKKDLLNLEVTRGEIKVKSVPYFGMIDENIGYIKLTSFTNKAHTQVKEALLSLKENNNLKGLVFDLRGNPGGLLRESVNIVNLFVDKGEEIVKTKGRLSDWDKVHRGLNEPIDSKLPIVCLVNDNSASASEIVSGAIQDLDRGVIIGQKTFGKGLVQQTLKLSYNSQLKVTTAKYYIPSGRCIQALDYSNKSKDGFAGKIPDSLIAEFKTKAGRVVYDGGGVLPDLKLDKEKPSKVLISLLNKMLIFDFATNYRLKNDSIDSVESFVFSDSDYTDFIEFLKDKEYGYSTRSEKALKGLKEIAMDEKYFDGAKEEYEALEKALIHSNEEDLLKFKSQIVTQIKKEIISRYYFQKGKIKLSLQSDKEIIKAVEVLNDSTAYYSTFIVPENSNEEEANK
jgi:carboxyl-terminal processing protease